MKYRARKSLVGVTVLVLFLALYAIAVPSGTPWFGKDSHILNLSLGLLTGFVVLLVQFVVDNQRDGELEELLETRIKRVLSSRDGADYYRRILETAKTEIIVFGVTANRFLTDFADVAHPEADKKVLISAIERGVKVRLLVAAREFLEPKDFGKFDDSASRLVQLKSAIRSGNLEVRYYEHAPTLAMVVADNDCLVGPVFPKKHSQHTPTIHALSGGIWAKLHVDNFEEEWKTGKAG